MRPLCGRTRRTSNGLWRRWDEAEDGSAAPASRWSLIQLELIDAASSLSLNCSSACAGLRASALASLPGPPVSAVINHQATAAAAVIWVSDALIMEPLSPDLRCQIQTEERAAFRKRRLRASLRGRTGALHAPPGSYRVLGGGVSRKLARSLGSSGAFERNPCFSAFLLL